MLLDTSGLLCYLDKGDSRHTDTVTLFMSAPRLVTHSYVLAELVPLGQARGLRRMEVLSLVFGLQDNSDVEMVWVDEFLHRGALALLQSRPDKTYSLCDAVSFLVMREKEITEALTTDRHFDQEGFVRLLKA